LNRKSNLRTCKERQSLASFLWGLFYPLQGFQILGWPAEIERWITGCDGWMDGWTGWMTGWMDRWKKLHKKRPRRPLLRPLLYVMSRFMITFSLCYTLWWVSSALGCSEIVGLDLAIRVGLGYCLVLGRLFWECPCPWNCPTQNVLAIWENLRRMLLASQ
jgi:hypothetical protein